MFSGTGNCSSIAQVFAYFNFRDYGQRSETPWQIIGMARAPARREKVRVSPQEETRSELFWGETGLKIRQTCFVTTIVNSSLKAKSSIFFIFSQKRKGKRNSSMLNIDSYVICLHWGRYLLV